jgi:RNA polymerase sigma-70 factor (ECF subfamily)
VRLGVVNIQPRIVDEVVLVPLAVEPLRLVLGFEEFYARARPEVVRALALTLGDVDLATEATDEALTRAYMRWSAVRDLGNPSGWVYRVGLNWARSVLRRRRIAQPALYQPDRVDLPPVADPAVHQALATLDVKHRAVVVCRFFLGWSEDETALALDVRPGTVKSRLHRAKAELRSRLGHLDPQEER